MLNETGKHFYEGAVAKGFWDEQREPGTLLMLIVSELSEALEELRNGHGLNEARTVWHSTPHSTDMPDITWTSHGDFFWYGTERQREVTDADYLAAGWLPKPEGVPSELADVIIRTLELCHAWGIDIDEAIRLKMVYNNIRGHMNGGKKF